jgi:hypothetical protein
MLEDEAELFEAKRKILSRKKMIFILLVGVNSF